MSQEPFERSEFPPRHTIKNELDAAEIRKLEAELAVCVEDNDGLRAEIDRLRALVKELADDLEAEVEGRHYRDTKGYPSELRRYERDIDSVKRARDALEPKP